MDDRPEVMRRWTLLAALALGSCGLPEERVRFPDVHASLVLLETDTFVGGPLRVRLNLVNNSDTAMMYDGQGCNSNDSFEIVGPDGKHVPFVDGPRSTFGTYSELAPRTSATLIQETDLTHKYVISKPGRYTIRFQGLIEIVEAARYRQSRKEAETDSSKAWSFKQDEVSVGVPSNAVSLDLRPGPVPERFIVAEKVLAALPKDWEFAINWCPPETSDPEYSLFRPGRKKGDSVIVLRLSSGPPLAKERRAGEALGKSVYVRSTPDDERAWPDHDRRLVEILSER